MSYKSVEARDKIPGCSSRDLVSILNEATHMFATQFGGFSILFGSPRLYILVSTYAQTTTHIHIKVIKKINKDRKKERKEGRKKKERIGKQLSS